MTPYDDFEPSAIEIAAIWAILLLASAAFWYAAGVVALRIYRALIGGGA
jgi:hypothetical protein